jgi:hypothetical protein
MTGTQRPVKRDLALTIITTVIGVSVGLFAVAAASFVFWS